MTTRQKNLFLIVLDIILFSIFAVFLMASFGCAQREYKHTTFGPTGIPLEVEHYKSNTIATDTQADSVYIEKPDGTIVEVNGIKQDSDSVKVITPYGIIETE
jgi:hypothetical protein